MGRELLCGMDLLAPACAVVAGFNLHGRLQYNSCTSAAAAAVYVWQFDESLIASLANEDLVDSLLAELQEDFPQLLKPLLHDRYGI